MKRSTPLTRVRAGLVLVVSALLTVMLGITSQTANAEPAVGEGFTVDVVHTNAQDTYVVGDRLSFSYSVTNLTSETRGIAIEEGSSNLTDDEWCQWNGFGSGVTLQCAAPGRVYHDVTQADLDAGSFTPTSTWNLHAGADRWVTEVVESLEVTGTAVTLPAGDPGPDPTEEPTEEPTVEPGEPAVPHADYDAVRGLDPFYDGPQQIATNGQDGFPNYRIPALGTATNGDLLAIYDGRPTGADSPGPNSILLRRSTDNGQTWGEQIVVAQGQPEAPKHGYSDPSIVVDRETGEIFVFHVYSMDQGFFGSQPGTDPDDRNVAHAAVSSSTDNGHTWTTEIITDQITPDVSWFSRFATSGNGIQLKYGEYAGRLVQNYPVRIDEGGNYVIRAVSVYSDDHGETWQAGEPVGLSMDENKVVELSDGRVMMNSRDNAGGGYRKVAISTDGGETYGEVVVDTELPDPTNNASLIRAFPEATEGSADAKILLFSNANSQNSRSNGTIRMSCDDGETWPIARTFEPGGMAYSTLSTQSDGTLGVLYEPGGGGAGIAYGNFSLSWLSDACIGLTSEAAAVDAGATVTVPVTVTNDGAEALTDGALTLDAPEGWTAVAAEVPAVAAGASAVVDVEITVPEDVVPNSYLINLTLDSAAGKSGGSVTVRINPAPGQFVTVTAEHTNPQDSYAVGDRLEFAYTVQNLMAETIAVVPSSDDLSAFNPPTAPNCRYLALAAYGQYTCTTAFHVVTEADLEAGSFTPDTTWTGSQGGTAVGVLDLATPTVELDGPAAPSTPEVIPSLTNWTEGEGSFTLTDGARIVATGDAAARGDLLTEELSVILGTDVAVVADGAQAGDVVLTIDETRTEELGDEGYELTIGDTVEIVAATGQGVFYGTRTLAQLLTQNTMLLQGSTVDVPEYAERGITVCACQINISTDWIDRLLEEMSYLKLNQILLELKVKTTDTWPQTHTWSYYTKDQIAELVAKADARGIEVIPEINSPGHLEIWLENLPDLQLQDVNGNRDEVRLDITKPEAFDFYTDLIDEYMDVFTGDYWHMGADEYMIHSGFVNFPQIEEYAEEELGLGEAGTPQDTFVWFVNKVNDYVKTEYGKTLRIWNDGLTGANTNIAADSDIIVEHWQNSPVEPADLVAAGHKVMNASYRLYLVRGGLKMNTANLWNNNWNVGTFYGGSTLPLDTPELTGAKISLWPDSASRQTENEVEEEMFMPLRFISQMTWSNEHAQASYAEFEQVARQIGRPLVWENVDRQPLPGGTYTITTTADEVLVADGSTLGTDASGTEMWTLTPTDDHYYRIASATSGLCLDVTDGPRRLGVPVGIGVPVVAATCDTSPSGQGNMQKWQLIADGESFEIVNAATQQRLSIEAGAIVQEPSDETDVLWNLEATLTVGSVVAERGASVDVPVSVNNTTDAALTGGSVSFDVPEGWTSDAGTVPTLEVGDTTDVTMEVFVPETALPGEYVIAVTLTTDQGNFPGFFTVTIEAKEGEYLTVVPSHTNPKDLDTYAVGDRINLTYTVTNVSDRAIGVRSEGAVDGITGCRYRTLAPGQSYDCAAPYHLVTQGDLDAGLYTPESTWIAFDGDYDGPELATLQIDGPQVGLTTSGPNPTPDPTDEPTEPPVGGCADYTQLGQHLIGIHDVSSAQTGDGAAPPEQAIDGSVQSIWHQEWAIIEPPHFIAFDMGEVYCMGSLIYTPRQSESVNGVLKDYEVYVTSDPENWGEPVASGSLEYTLLDSVLELDGAVGQYVKLVFLDSYNDNDTMVNATAAEINFTAATFTPEPDPTDEPTDEPTGEPTDEPTGEPTSEPTTEPTSEPTSEPTTEPTDEPTSEPTDEPTDEPTSEPTATQDTGSVYTTPGFHYSGGRHWYTECEPYSQTTRCTTEIWASTVISTDSGYQQVNDWVFNNLTYLPSARSLWANNPLGNDGRWTAADGRSWLTECDTARTGRNGCRSYAEASVVAVDGNGGFIVRTEFVFNNIVLFS